MNPQQIRSAAARLIGIYLVAGAAWILLSDRALLFLIPDATVADISDYQTLKGWLFIVLTGLLLSILLRRALTDQVRIQQELDRAEYQHLQRLALLEVGVYETDAQGRLRFTNHIATEQCGVTGTGQPREACFHLIEPPHRHRVAAAWTAALQQHKQFLEQYPVRLPGESALRWLIDSAYPHYTDTTFNGLVGTVTDVTEIAREQELRDLYAAAFSGLSEGILIVDQDHVLVSANHAFSSISGIPPARLAGLNIDELDAACERDRSGFRDVMDMLDNQANWHGEIHFSNHQGQQVPLAITASVVHSPTLATHKRVLICRDISADQRFRDDLVHLAHYDSLTNLPNRLLLTSRLEHAIERARRKNQRLAVLFMDLDDFKTLNDRYGHVAGDEVLVEAARRLQQNLRKSDTLARLGGDEFVCLIEDLGAADAAASKAQEFIASLGVMHTLGNGRECSIACCIGISLFPDHGDNWQELLQNADTAMYRSKGMGGGRYCFFSDDLGESTPHHGDTGTP